MALENTRPAALAEQLTALRQVIQKTTRRFAGRALRIPQPARWRDSTQADSELDRLTKLIANTETQFRHTAGVDRDRAGGQLHARTG